MEPTVTKLELKNFHCEFNGLTGAQNGQVTLPVIGIDTFNTEEAMLEAFSIDEALFIWLREIWDFSLSINVPSTLGNDSLNYGLTYQEFTSSKDVEFTLLESSDLYKKVSIKYKGRNDFWYEFSAKQQ